MPAEGRDLASERVVRQVDTQEIGDEPITSAHGWETSGDTTHQSERVAWLSVLGVVRQAVPPGRAGTCLRPLPCQRRGRRGGWPDVHGHRDVRRADLAGRTGTRTEREDVSTPGSAAGVDTQGGRLAASVRNPPYLHPRGADGCGAGPRTDFRGRSAAGAVRLPGWTQRPGGGAGSPGLARSRLYGGGRRGLERVFRQHPSHRTDEVGGSAGQRPASTTSAEDVATSAGRGNRRTRAGAANDTQQGRKTRHSARRSGLAVVGESVYAAIRAGLEAAGAAATVENSHRQLCRRLRDLL